jgi:SAM-dependent methyltransferase
MTFRTGTPKGAPVAASPARREAAVRLAGYSFLILFFELALIRYTAGYVRVFGFYLNFVLIATFLGMGLGLLRSSSSDRLRWIAPLALLALLGSVWYLSRTAVIPAPSRTEHVWGVFLDPPNVRRIGTTPVVIGLFTLCALFFVPLGALMGQEFRRLGGLVAYSADIVGSLAGIVAFGAMSALGAPPLAWFACGLVAWIALSLRSRGFAAALCLASLGAIATIRATAVPGELWSPYYRIAVDKSEDGPRGYPFLQLVWVNGSLHQYAVDFDSSSFKARPFLRDAHAAYVRPFAHVPRLDTALVVGAGTGNDVSLLLRAGARHVDAVEIDPMILELGRDRHPMRPYQDPRVTPVLADARAFLKRSTRKYDVIVFGTLDSQTLLSGMSSVRLDNYVYTQEAFQAAHDHLKPDGTLVVYHMSGAPFIESRIYQMIAVAFRSPPLAIRPEGGFFNLTVIAGAGARTAASSPVPPTVLEDVTLPSDNWPYLYLRGAGIPEHYLIALAAVLLIGLLLTGTAAGPSALRSFDGAMFFMGAGFMLVETKSVTEMSLLFGSTWYVNLLVFSSVLVVILIANVLALRGRVWPVPRLFAALFVALGAAVLAPASALLSLGTLGQWIVGGALVAMPILFAALIFAALLAASQDARVSLAYNVMGAVIGGILEYSSMALGIKALYLLAAGAYAAAFLVIRARAARAATSMEGSPAALEAVA